MLSIDATPYTICSENRNLEQVFRKYGVAPASKQRLHELFVDPNFVVAVLTAVDDAPSIPESHFSTFSTPVVLDYLQHSHRFYLEAWIPEITHLLQHLVQITGDAHPMLVALPAFWRSYRFELQKHFTMEEEGLFPYARLLHKRSQSVVPVNIVTDDLKGFSLDRFVHDHIDETNELGEIRTLLRRYAQSTSGSFPYRILLHKLRLFEQDMFVHGFLEDHVLVPRLRHIEDSMRASVN